MNELLEFINKSQDLSVLTDKEWYQITFEHTDLRTIQRFSNLNYIKVIKINYNSHVFIYKLIDDGVYVHAFNKL